jgi:predicted transcriptional regulator
MKKLKIGIMPRDQFQQRVLDIASGKLMPARGDPKIWFSSLRSLSEVLSENNVRLLQMIDEHQPETVRDLAVLSGRQPGNLSRTLKTLERYGLVELRRSQRAVQPIVKATQFDIRYRFG